MQQTGGLAVEQVEARLSERIGRDQVVVDEKLAQRLNGQMTPVVKATPGSEEQTVEVFRTALEYGLTVAPIGGATQLSMGNIPQPIDVVVSSERMNQLVDYSPADMVVSVQPGVTLNALQAVLAKRGQQLPIDPLVSSEATIGGIVASGVSGPMRTLYGGLRDMTIGLRTVYPDGSLVKTGGKVVKNVAGYDMTKLFVGSLGTLAYITEVAFKLRPLPAHVELCLISGSLEQVRELSLKIIHSHLIPARMEALTGGLSELEQPNRPWVLAVESHENETSAAYQSRQLQRWAQDLGMDSIVLKASDADHFWKSYRQQLLPTPVVIRLTAAPNRMMDLVHRLRNQLKGFSLNVQISAAVFLGVARIYVDGKSLVEQERTVQMCRELVTQNNGTAVVESASLELRRRVDSFGPVRSDFVLMKGIKSTIDPNQRMNPGRFVGGI